MPTTSVLLTAQDRFLRELAEELASLEADDLRRRLTTIDAVDGPRVRIAGRELIAWCSNDYLGLAAHPALADAAATAAAEWGIGARASRLLAGSTRWHARLEEALAAWFGTEEAIVYPSGYLANLGTLGALLAPGDTVFLDRLAHASLFDAVRATRARLRVFRHNDLSHLASLLARAGAARRRLIVTEGIFSMEGDACPLAELVELAEAHGALVYLDDAHGAFVAGPTGRGVPEAAGVPHERFLYMATLGKGLGAQGGFVVGPRTLIEFLRNRARTFIYTTALAVPVAAAAAAALRLLDEEPARRERLRTRTRQLSERLVREGLATSPPLQMGGSTAPVAPHIVPVVLGQAQRAVDVARRLWDRGCWIPAIRPPTVPEGTARLRLSVTALHTESHVEALVEALREALT